MNYKASDYTIISIFLLLSLTTWKYLPQGLDYSLCYSPKMTTFHIHMNTTSSPQLPTITQEITRLHTIHKNLDIKTSGACK